MSARPTGQQPNRTTTDGTRRILILANEVVGDEALVREILRHTEGQRAEAMIVAPALVESPLDLAAGDVDDDIAQARGRLEASIKALEQNGIQTRGTVGDADPNLALEDALRLFPADEVIMVVHPSERRTWLEQDVVEQARRALKAPITIVEVDPDAGAAAVRDVKQVSSAADQADAERDQQAFEADYLPPMPRRDKAALIVGPLGCIALALLATDCRGQLGDIGSWDAGCYTSWVGGVYAFIVTAIHVPAILVLQGERYARGLRNFMSISVLFIIPVLVLIAAIAVLMS